MAKVAMLSDTAAAWRRAQRSLFHRRRNPNPTVRAFVLLAAKQTPRLHAFSDEETEAFAAASGELPAADGYRRDREQSRADANTESNDWLINEPPGRPRRPLPTAGESYEPEHALLRPVLPTVLRYDPDEAAEGGPPGPVAAVQHATGAEPVPIQNGDGTGENEIAQDSTEGQRSVGPLGHDTRNAGNTTGESRPETDGASNDVVAPMRIDSTVLFASLSSSTASASLSSKSMARAEGKGLNPVRELTGGRQAGDGSSSTFALSADDVVDDTGMASAMNRSTNAALRSSASLDKPSPGGKHGSAANENGAAADSMPETESESRASPPEDGNGVLHAETSRRSTISQSPGGTGDPEEAPVVPDDEVMALEPTPSPRAPAPPPRAEPTRPSAEHQPAASLEDNERRPQRDQHQVVEGNGETDHPTGDAGSRPSTPPALGGTAEEPAAKPDEDVAVHSAEGDYGPRSGRKGEDEGVAADRSEEGTAVDGGRNGVDDKAEGASLGENEGLAGESSTREHEGSVAGALEEQSSVGQDSSHGGSVLDVGGGGVDNPGDDDDDGYF